ncbi:MAG: glycosyltransferase [Geminicoccaceae bacterium]
MSTPSSSTVDLSTKGNAGTDPCLADRPRILFLDQSGVLGGAELSLLDIARHYRAHGRVVLFQDGPFARKLSEAGIATQVLPPARWLPAARRDSGGLAGLAAACGFLPIVLRLARLARTADLLYANTQKAFVAAALAGIATRRPVLWHLRDILSVEHFSRSNLRLVVGLARACHARVIANSHATMAAFVAAGGDARRVVAIRNGIDPAPSHALDQGQRQELRASLGLGLGIGSAPLIGLFGRLAPWKGQHVLVTALERLPEAHALLVGDALFGEQAYRDALLAQVARLGLAGRVHLTGFRSDVPQLMQLCDVVAHTSTAPEPFGRVIIEAMLAGRPVVASAAGGPVEIIEHGQSGLLVPPGDPAALAAALAELLDQPARAEALAAAGRQRALREFSLATMLRRLDQVLLAELAPAAPPLAAATG